MPTVAFKPYRTFPTKLGNKLIDLDSDAITATLHTSSYVPNLDTDATVAQLTNELPTSGGYTVGGLPVGSLALVQTAANAWSRQWAATTAYAVGDTIRPTSGNGHLYQCVVAGTSGSSAPTFPTIIGLTVTDGGAVWACKGGGATTLAGAAVTWASPFTAPGIRYLVLSDRTPSGAANQPLIALADFGSDQAGGGGAFTVQPDVAGYLIAFPLS